MNSLEVSNFKIEETEGVFTFKNENTTVGFVRFNEKGEVEYIFVNPIFTINRVYLTHPLKCNDGYGISGDYFFFDNSKKAGLPTPGRNSVGFFYS